MTQSNLFAGFVPFATPVAPEGSLTLQYGLSVQVVQIEAEGHVKPEAGVTAADLAKKYATAFNMPSEGLKAYIDGKEVPMGSSIPAGAKTLEFRQPAGEKGASATPTFMIPLRDEDAILIRVFRQDTINYQSMVEEVLGKLTPPQLAEAITLNPGVLVLRTEGEFAIIGRRSTVTKATRSSNVLVSEMRRRVQGGLTTTRALSINDVRAQFPGAFSYRLNGETVHRGICRELVAGDVFEVMLIGNTRVADFDVWAAEQRAAAEHAYQQAYATALYSWAVRKAQIDEIGWAKLRAAASGAGVKIWHRTAEAIRADLLAQEFPPMAGREEWVNNWLTEHAPEVLSA